MPQACITFRFWCLFITVIALWNGPTHAEEFSQKLLENLNSEKFQVREAAQAELLVWSRLHRSVAIDELYLLSRKANDPEVRERCLSVLRELVLDDYLQEGDGYIGIMMQDEATHVPGDAKLRSAIRIIRVVPESGAHQAGLQINDLIVGLENDVWHDAPASLPFSEKVRKLKPTSKVKLKVLKDGVVSEVGVTLGRRPNFPVNPFLDNGALDIEAAQKAEKDAFFRLWLNQKKHPK